MLSNRSHKVTPLSLMVFDKINKTNVRFQVPRAGLKRLFPRAGLKGLFVCTNSHESPLEWARSELPIDFFARRYFL